MLSFCRSGLLALTLMSGSIAGVQASDIQRTAHQDWFSDFSVEQLKDESVLVEYFGEGPSKEHDDIFFRIGFVPRFGCAPLITFQIGDSAYQEFAKGVTAGPSSNEQSLDNAQVINQSSNASISVAIDGSTVSFPSLIDDKGTSLSIYMNANLQRRITTRIRSEVGSKVRLQLNNGKVLNFSLAGSRDAISTADNQCRRHRGGSLTGQ